MRTKIIQITSHCGYLIALCEDGSLWRGTESVSRDFTWSLFYQ